MAEKQLNQEEASPLLHQQQPQQPKTEQPTPPEFLLGWTADGLPLGHGSVVGQPMAELPGTPASALVSAKTMSFAAAILKFVFLGVWLLVCCMEAMLKDLDQLRGHLPIIVCLILAYSSCAMGYMSVVVNLYQVIGSCEALNRSCGCCGSCLEDEAQREQCESVCDLATHVFCHVCALCQEGRELRRRLPHPGFNAQPVLVMIPPAEQTMGRGA
ncbi:putative cell number regulator 8-like [Sesbania bispinosa]|nr:putative cell number regulator 8-like [Sesbania bispinosa]